MPTYGPDSSGEFLRASAIDYRDALPATGDFVGHLVNLTTGSVGLYSWDGASWVGPFGTGGGGGGAPTTAQYLVGAADAGLSAERVVTDTGEVTWDLGTAGQAKANVGAIAESKVTNLVSDLATLASAITARALASRLISTTAPLQGGGDLTADRTLSINLSGTSFPGSPADGQLFLRTDLGNTLFSYKSSLTAWLSVQIHEVPYGQTTATATNGFFKLGGSNGAALFSANFGHLFGFNVAVVGISWRSVSAPSAGTATVAVFANNVAVASATMNVGAADTSKTREDFFPAAAITAGQTIQVKNTGAATSATSAQGVIRLRRRET